MKIVRYAYVGGVAAFVDLVIFLLFAKWIGFNYLLVGGAGFVLATGVNYLLSIRYVFISGVRFSRRKEVVGVYVISGIGLLLHELVLYICVSSLGIELVSSKIIAIGAIFFWNYYARHHFLFAKEPLC